LKVPLLAATILLLMVSFTHGAGTGPLTTTTYQTLAGAIFKITGAFTVTQTQLSFYGANIPATTSCTWGVTPSGQCFMNRIFAGNWSVIVILQLNPGFVPTSPTSYTIKIFAGQFGFTSMTFSVPSTATAPSPMEFPMDLGTSTLPSLTAFQIQVQ
jgi:hypothetical protein